MSALPRTSVRFPALPLERSLGVGLDLRYGDPHGFEHVPLEGGRSGDRVSPRVLRFLERHAADFRYAFFSFQPKDRAQLDLGDYAPAWDHLFEHLPSGIEHKALHHTLLNLGSLDDEERGPLLDFTNELCERYDLAWVNEDLGIWSLSGKLMPYPLPPLLSEAGLEKAIAEVSSVNARLARPLLVEFPGFSEGTNFVVGDLHAYDYFRTLADETNVAITLDTGHLLSYQWLKGRRGAALYDELERLPLSSCFEIHLSGCQLIEDRFVDVHHGVLRDEQLELLQRLLPLCPNVRAVTYEDPKPDVDGALRSRAAAPFERLRRCVELWRNEHSAPKQSAA